ncbi:MAG: hypothetical protein EOO05_20370 [Chitinophagaceae bacterium]|nr:MAG: hypothetical protein EOO05_20370 [Chitinophagaceae bacterium]
MRPLLETYLGSLPGTGRQETPRDYAVRIPSGRIRKEWRLGNNDKASVRLIVGGEYEYSQRTTLELKAIAKILESRLREKLKEAEKGEGAPTVTVDLSKFPAARYMFRISFDVVPAKVDKLITAVELEVRRMKVFGPTIDDLDRFINAEVDATEVAIGQNEFWLYYLSRQYQDQEDLTDIVSYYQRLDKIDREFMRQTANLYLGDENVVALIWLPENTPLTPSK